jgi:Flp pilus assembly protein TadD
MLGRVHERRNESPEADAAFARVAELDPTRVDARVKLIESAINKTKFDEAVAHGEAARKVDPKNTAALTALGLAYQLKGDVEKARQAYEQALAANPTYVPASNNLALLLSESGVDQKAALQHAAVALKGAPNDPHVKDTAGWILFRVGQYAEAFKLLTESALALPKNLEIQYHLGMAAQKVGDTVTARQALRNAAESPTNFRGKDEARKALAILK